MKNLISLIIFLLFANVSWAQPYGNEWVNYNQTYYKFPIAETGIYRITFQDLYNAGVPLSQANPQNIQIFGKQKEIPLYIKDGGDNEFNPGDYIEFYAERNDGWLDSILYNSPEDIGNPYYSLYNDTLFYFLTWTSGLTKRYLEETDINFSLYQPAEYVFETKVRSFNSMYYGGFSQFDAYSSFYSPGEGWGGQNRNGASNYTEVIALPTPSVYQGGGAPDAIFHAKSNSNSNASFTGTGNHHLRWEVGSNNVVLFDEVFTGYQQKIVNTPISPSELSSGNTDFYFNIIGDQGATTDYQSISFLSLKYPRTTQTSEQYFHWEIPKANIQAKSRIDINGASLINPSAYVFGGGINRKIPFVFDNGVWKGLIPNVISNTQQLVLASQNKIKNISSLQPVNGTGKFIDYKSLNLEDAYIMVYNKKMQSSVENYANYRRSVNGGMNNVILIDVEDVSMQYGGGIPKHILGIRRVANEIYNYTTQKPKALFLVGKGMTEASYPNMGSGNSPRKNSTVNEGNLVPSYGFPSSDMCITAKWNGSSSLTPAIPTGRIAARNNAELELYLAKMQIYEAQQNQTDIYNKERKEWQKQILHFGGGSIASEQLIFKSYLNGMKQTIEGPDYGGNVHSYFKTTSDPFNPIQSSEVNELLEKGVSLMNFFGHATAEGFDQNLDNPSNWGNTGKYPMVLGNGCYTGNIFKPDNNSTAESFVFVEDLGAIGFLSSSELGFASYLNMYSSELYRQISPLNYGGTIGEQIVETIRKLDQNNSGFLVEAMTMQFILHGDPGMKLNWHAKPEIDLTSQDVSFGPVAIDLSTDSIYVQTILTNLGRSIVDTFSFTVTRNFPNSAIDSVYHFSIPKLNYKDTVVFAMPLQASIGGGLNEFTIQADIPSFISEQYDEYGNNQVITSFFINIDGIMPVWPYDYAVVPKDSVVVKASTINPIASFKTYRFEIDTTDLYNSPFKKYALVSGLGGVKEVHPTEWISASSNMPSSLILEDSVSYFWRVSIDSSVLDWRERSFQYIPNKRGWGQAHFFQFKNGEFSGIEYDRNERKRHFQSQDLTVFAQVHDNPTTNYEFASTLWRVNGIDAEYGMCSTAPSIHVGVVDPSTMEPWGTAYQGQNPDHNFGNANNESACRTRVEHFFIFRQNSTAQLQAFANMIDAVPDGHILVIYTASRAMYSQWQTYYPDLFNLFNSLGATGMTPTSPQRAFIMIAKKGVASSAETIHAQFAKEFIQLSRTYTGAIGQGVETSTIIGPSIEWKTVYWKQGSLETPSNDSTRLVIRGLNKDKQPLIEIDTVFTSNDSILYLNDLIPASNYPYLQLRAKYFDPVTVSPAQVNRWHVLYEDVPEAAIDGSNGVVLLPQDSGSLQEGVEVKFAIDVKNISDLHMDSLLVHYWVVDENNIKHPINYPRRDSLRINQVIRDTISFSTVGMPGFNTLWMEVNPYTKGINQEFKDQPELTHFNNLLQIPFTLSRDEINPILDVTFDGEHILNGDIVSPFTEIVISLQDENPFLLMNEDTDTSNFGIYLTDPSGNQKHIPFMDGEGNQILEWIPATESNLRFKIIYNAEFKEGGEYELFVQGVDKAGNLSGDIEYRIRFEVDLESSITHLMNYPNPFSTSTRFVFTLTGMEVPDDMIIQIMTVTGRIVREITEDELGPIHIGRNITEYAWDGRDEFGDQLANGVYLYRVKAKINGEDIKHRASGADQYFKRNWGKMYLMR
ncbi:MAG: C25 family cysteine peptidase [Brumimicrobium sp.]